jgi:mercuric ion transport protein
MIWKGVAGEGRLSNATALVSAALAASCCLLPLALIAAGVAGAGLMMTMMRYEWLTLPAGVVGLGGAYAVYLSRRRQCAATGCRFVGQRTTQAVLVLATIVVVTAILLRVFPFWTAALLQHQH